MGKIGKALGYSIPDMSGSGDDSSESDPTESEGSDDKASTPGKGEVIAMRQFMNADTAEAKAQAMKDFMELCGY